MSRWLEGNRALVIGAGSGIGRAVVDVFISEGARVAALELDPTKSTALHEAFPEVRVICGDATTRAANEEAVATAIEAFDGLDVLVNCVGIFDFYRSVEDIDSEVLDDAFDEIFHVNVKALLHGVQAALPALKASGHGSIVLTESTSAYQPGRGGVLYVSSKFAVRGLVMSLAHDLAPDVRVNGVAPGGTLNTDLRGPRSLHMDQQSLGAAPGRAEEMAARSPLHVALSGEDHAWSYVFLASDRSRGITGRSLHPDGGAGVSAPKKRR